MRSSDDLSPDNQIAKVSLKEKRKVRFVVQGVMKISAEAKSHIAIRRYEFNYILRCW